jgi:hypothetical protein
MSGMPLVLSTLLLEPSDLDELGEAHLGIQQSDMNELREERLALPEMTMFVEDD